MQSTHEDNIRRELRRQAITELAVIAIGAYTMALFPVIGWLFVLYLPLSWISFLMKKDGPIVEAPATVVPSDKLQIQPQPRTKGGSKSPQ